MGRLTCRDDENRIFYESCLDCEVLVQAGMKTPYGGSCIGCFHDIIHCAKLADYEDAEEQGRLFKFPVAIGDTIYTVDGESITKAVITGYDIRGSGKLLKITCEQEYWSAEIPVRYLGTTWFSTLEEAKKALKEGFYESGRTVD